MHIQIRNQKSETRQSEPDENINIIPEIFYGYFNFWWLRKTEMPSCKIGCYDYFALQEQQI